MSPAAIDISGMSLEDRVTLLDKIWASIRQETPVFPVPEWLKKELDDRHEEYLRDPSQAMTWEQCEAEIMREHGWSDHTS